jgi:hypothetical protein
MRKLLIAVAITFILTGCVGFTSGMHGEWSGLEANDLKLTITPDTLQIISRQETWKFKYKIITSDENKKTFTAELDDDVSHNKENITIVMQEGGALHITWHARGINGHWKRSR